MRASDFVERFQEDFAIFSDDGWSQVCQEEASNADRWNRDLHFVLEVLGLFVRMTWVMGMEKIFLFVAVRCLIFET
jgi:hypothetical protein